MLTVDRLEFEQEDFDFLFYEIEQSFWTDWDKFSRQEFAKLDTVGALFDAVVRQRGVPSSDRCFSSLAFYRLRRSLIDLTGLDRQSVKPTMPLRRTLSPKTRIAWWQAIETDLRLHVPSLQLSRLALAVHYSSIGFALLAFFLVAARLVSEELSALLQWGTPILVWALWRAASHLPREIPAETLGDLVRVVVMLNQGKLAQEAGGFAMNEAWTAFKKLLSRETGVPAVYITRETRLAMSAA